MLKKKLWPIFKKIIELFTSKIVTKLSKIWVRDPGSGKTPFRIPDPDLGVKKAPDPGSGSATLPLSQLYGSVDLDPYQNVTDPQN
jgi:hypothetical protein